MTQRNTPERREMLAARAEAREERVPRFTPVPRQRRRLSTRGQTGQPWRTKRWTESRFDALYPSELDKIKAAHQRRGVELVHTLYARAMA